MHKKEIIVRHHNKEDIPGILALLVKCFPVVWGNLVKAGRRETWYNSDSTVAICEGRIAGNCGLLRYPVMIDGKLTTAANIGSVAVDPDCRGMGIAKLMLKEIINTALEEKIFFSALFTGTPAVYENSGWKIFKMAPSLSLEVPQTGNVLPENILDIIDDGLLKKIADIYENSFSFNGKVQRSLEYWKGHILAVPFRKQSWLLKHTDGKLAAYALVICNDNEGFTLAEAFSLNDNPGNLKSLLDDALAVSNGKLICPLPPNHPMRKIISENYSEFAKSTEYHPIMINIIDDSNEKASKLKEIASKEEFYWAYADSF